jgi:hypothetical protein
LPLDSTVATPFEVPIIVISTVYSMTPESVAADAERCPLMDICSATPAHIIHTHNQILQGNLKAYAQVFKFHLFGVRLNSLS